MIPENKQLKCRPRGKPWPPGVSGNSAGRPRGALNRFSLAVKGEPLAVNPHDGREPEPVKFDPRRPHEHSMTKVAGEWLRTIIQDGWLFDRDTGALIDTRA